MKDMLNYDKLLTTAMAADIIGISPGTLNNWRIKNEGPEPTYVGRLVKYRYRDIIRYLDQRPKTRPAS